MVGVLTNGIGEDTFAFPVVKELSQEFPLLVFPLIGDGNIFKQISNVEILHTSSIPPSGGIIFGNLKGLINDIKSGIITLPFKYINTLKEYKTRMKVAFIVGDPFLLVLSALGLGKDIPKVFYLSSKSVNAIYGLMGIEIMFMKRFAEKVFTRDKETAEFLQKKGVNAEFVGALMMDLIPERDFDCEKFYKNKTIKVGLLPGTKHKSYINMHRFLDIISLLPTWWTSDIEFFAVPHHSFNIKEMWENYGNKERFEVVEIGDDVLILKLVNSVIATVYIDKKKDFFEFLHCMDIFLGTVGTVIEQVVGMGKPVITIEGADPHSSMWRLKNQKKMLKDIPIILNYKHPETFWTTITHILQDKKLKTLLETEKENIGKRGGYKEIVEFLKTFLV